MAKFLVVDDAYIMRINIIKHLEKMGHEVIAQAQDGYEAVEAYKKYLPDIIIMDITMPNKNGLDALIEIKSINPRAKVIMLTSNGDQSVIINSINKGANGFIIKPFEPNELEKILTRLAS